MLSAVVLYEVTHRSPGVDPAETLVRTLSSLVRANVEGLLRDVAIAGPASQGLEIIADHAGCGLIEAIGEPEWLREAIEAARGPHILLIRSGFAPQQGFIEEAGDFLQRPPRANGAEVAVLRAAPERLFERMFPGAAPLAGLIAPRDRCLKGSAKRLVGLAQFLRPATTLRTHARRIA
ncbi:transposase [Methylocella silvestris]|nr:transposase [Methylocella silvestris]